MGRISSLKKCKFSFIPILRGFFSQLYSLQKDSTVDTLASVEREASHACLPVVGATPLGWPTDVGVAGLLAAAALAVERES